ncbi:MAG: hypothetical protein ORO03_08590 [Alphaproteobacteria bacterium]|nr:hypothetical protein [Alphaproteobacteria bacterium]
MIHNLKYGDIDVNWDDRAGTITSTKAPSWAMGMQDSRNIYLKNGFIPATPNHLYIIHIKNDPLKNAPEFLACLGNSTNWKLPPSLNWDMVKPLIEMLPEEDFNPDLIY